jgi:hypothetical protein
VTCRRREGWCDKQETFTMAQLHRRSLLRLRLLPVQAAFRARLPDVHGTWKERLGTSCWTLLEANVGKLG